jgi:hypothetical protein
MNDASTTDDTISVGSHEYPADIYEPTRKAIGSQQEVADWWASGRLPTHMDKGNRVLLASGTRNFRGYQYPSGYGKLKHYRTIEAIRTVGGLVVSNTECYARGWAHCSTPSRSACPGRKESFPLTTLSKPGRDLKSLIDVQSTNYPPSGQPYDREYDRLAVFEDDAGNIEAYPAKYDCVGDEALTGGDIDAFLDTVIGDDNV